MNEVLAFIFMIIIGALAIGSLEGLNNRSRYNRIKFMLDHESAKHVLHRQKYFCKCGKRKRLSQVVCEECYRDGRE